MSAGEDLRDDLRRRLVVERALSALVESAVQVNNHIVAAQDAVAAEDYYGSFLAAAEVGLLPRALAERLAPWAGLRNRVVHEYERVDLEVVAAAVDSAVRGFREYVRTVAGWLDERSATG